MAKKNALPNKGSKKFKAKSVQSTATVPTKPAKVVEAAVNATTNEPPKKSFLQKIGEVVGPVAKAVLPEAAGMIPVVGPLLKNVLSTLNDDEWFSQFKAAGATFNELLGDIPASSGNNRVRQVTGNLGVFLVSVFEDSSTAVITWKDLLLPTLLAYVRSKTDNVLVASENDYWNAFKTIVVLEALYFTFKKYVELAKDVPLNSPNLTTLLTPVMPANYSQMVGIVDNLRDYLITTTGLPYAMHEYLRWRFGTSFLSENTGRAGIIHYDAELPPPGPISAHAFVWDSSMFPSHISVYIDTLKSNLATYSRATADLALAFKDHARRMDVEKRHYDEKEFNLRCNLGTYANKAPSAVGDVNGIMLYLDSRLDSSAALQAVTLSTPSDINNAPFHITYGGIAFYRPASYVVDFKKANATSGQFTVTAGWHHAEWDVAVGGIQAVMYYGIESSQLSSPTSYVARMLGRNSGGGANTTELTAAMNEYNYFCIRMAADSLQMHKNIQLAVYWNEPPLFANESTKIAEYAYVGKPLAYDAALITLTQVASIHRMALRNLTRGDYKQKTQPADKPSVVQATSDLVEVVGEQIIKNA